MRTVLLILAAAAALASPADAQTSATARATLRVTDLLELRVVETGEHVRLDVVANRDWQLVAVLEDETGGSWPAGPVASGGPGRTPLELSYDRLLAAARAPDGAALRFTLTTR